MIHPTPRRRLALVAIGLTTVCALPAAAQVVNEDYIFFPADNAEGDEFGWSIAISGSIAVVGSPKDGENGIDSGSAYIFDLITGQQVTKLIPDDNKEGDQFGWSVAITGNIVIIGARRDDEHAYNSGSAYLFDLTTGQQIMKLVPEDGDEDDIGIQFGSSVAASGTVAIIGAGFDNENGRHSGSAFLFDISTGQQIAKLLPDDGDRNDYFGTTVSIDGTTAIVGAYGNDDFGENSGSAYLFDTSTATQIFKLSPDPVSVGDLFGTSVSISGTTAVVGAPRDSTLLSPRSGSAYIFDTKTGMMITKVYPIDRTEDDYFGGSVSISGNILLVGAPQSPGNGNTSGSSYMFNITSEQQIAKLLPSDGDFADRFGAKGAIEGTTAVVGAFRNDDNGNDSGSAYLYTIEPCPADFTGDRTLNYFDVSFYLAAYNAQDPAADFNADGLFNFFDVSAFVEAYLNGCP